MRLIDADELERVFIGKHYGVNTIKYFIKTQPTIDPVKRGRWIEENRRPKSSLFYCSECHKTAYDIQPARAEGWVKRCRYAYCPNCGAFMKGEQDETD